MMMSIMIASNILSPHVLITIDVIKAIHVVIEGEWNVYILIVDDRFPAFGSVSLHQGSCSIIHDDLNPPLACIKSPHLIPL